MPTRVETVVDSDLLVDFLVQRRLLSRLPHSQKWQIDSILHDVGTNEVTLTAVLKNKPRKFKEGS